MLFDNFFNKNISKPDSRTPWNPSNVDPNTGTYDLIHLSKSDKQYINDCIKEANQYPRKLRALRLAECADTTIYAPRYILNRYITIKYELSNKPFDYLAVAIAYKNLGSLERQNAITYFEKYLNCLNHLNPNSYVFTTKHTFSDFYIYRNLSDLYEKEYELNKAYELRLKIIELQNGTIDFGDVMSIGNILRKIDINKSVSFYEQYINLPKIQGYRKELDKAYQDALKKQSNGYVYKPRPKPPDEHHLYCQRMEIKGAMKFIIRHIFS
ncbi:MAG: hypothetical protein ACLVCT_02440 [Lachnospira sp.]